MKVKTYSDVARETQQRPLLLELHVDLLTVGTWCLPAAAAFGNGTYFAVNPAYSAQGYAQPDLARHKRMYLARVLVGDFTQGRAGLVTPPNKNTGNPSDLYDSVTDISANPTMFIVFNDIQAYPEYLITFT